MRGSNENYAVKLHNGLKHGTDGPSRPPGFRTRDRSGTDGTDATSL